MQKTVVGAFDSYAAAQSVVRDLQADGFMARDMNVLAHNLGEDAELALGKLRRIQTNRAVPRQARRRVLWWAVRRGSRRA